MMEHGRTSMEKFFGKSLDFVTVYIKLRKSYLPVKCNADVLLYFDSEAVAEDCMVQFQTVMCLSKLMCYSSVCRYMGLIE
jgi:hypothetical protein